MNILTEQLCYFLFVNKKVLDPLQTRDLVVDNYLWSPTKSYRERKNVVCGARCRQLNLKLLVWFINRVDNVNWPPNRDWKADFSSVSHSSDSLWRRANARNVSFSISLRCSIYIINSVDKPNFSCITPPPTQHHSFFRNQSPLLKLLVVDN